MTRVVQAELRDAFDNILESYLARHRVAMFNNWLFISILKQIILTWISIYMHLYPFYRS